MQLKSSVYVQNHLNFSAIQVAKFNRLFFSTSTYMLIKVLQEIGFIYKFLIITKNKPRLVFREILITMFFYKQSPFFKSCSLVSTPSKSFFITLKALRILKINLNQSVLILSTTKGVITHFKALSLNVGGLLLYVLR
jgi:ribosomal protein S8